MPFENLLEVRDALLGNACMYTLEQIYTLIANADRVLCVPSPVLSILHGFTDLIPHSNSGARHHCHFPATERETVVQNGQVTCPNCHTS